MGNFRSGGSRGGFENSRGGNRFGGGRNRSFGGNRGGFGDRGDRPREMHNVTCDKCGKNCQVPFRPSGDKPVYCSDCFRDNESPRSNFAPRAQNKSSSSISQEQFSQINAKLDKILKVLQELEIDAEESEDEDLDEVIDDEEDSEK